MAFEQSLHIISKLGDVNCPSASHFIGRAEMPCGYFKPRTSCMS